MALRYMAVVEQAEGNLGGWFPDLPGCIATGRDLEELTSRLAEALRAHLHGMREDGHEPPVPTAQSVMVQAE